MQSLKRQVRFSLDLIPEVPLKSYKSQEVVRDVALKLLSESGDVLFLDRKEYCKSMAEHLFVSSKDVEIAVYEIASEAKPYSLSLFNKKISDFITKRHIGLPFKVSSLKSSSYPRPVTPTVFPGIEECKTLTSKSVREFYSLNMLYGAFKRALISVLSDSLEVKERVSLALEKSCLANRKKIESDSEDDLELVQIQGPERQGMEEMEQEKIHSSFLYYLESKSDFIARELVSLLESFETTCLKDVWMDFKEQFQGDTEQSESYFLDYIRRKLLCQYREKNRKIDKASPREIADIENWIGLYEEPLFNQSFWAKNKVFASLLQGKDGAIIGVTRYEIPLEDFQLFDDAINGIFSDGECVDFLRLCIRTLVSSKKKKTGEDTGV